MTKSLLVSILLLVFCCCQKEYKVHGLSLPLSSPSSLNVRSTSTFCIRKSTHQSSSSFFVSPSSSLLPKLRTSFSSSSPLVVLFQSVSSDDDDNNISETTSTTQQQLRQDYPLDVPSPILLASSMVLAIAATGSIFELSGGSPAIGTIPSILIILVGMPSCFFLFYAAIKKGAAETEADDLEYNKGNRRY
mmetsp:Transcript_15926/g.22689  ORF Transcript_15926/g.22689 Transcript_15926/m.22689 type:complete len:190 (-) Transcript_15926:267-836(-)